MPLTLEADRALLAGVCGVEVAEPLLAWLSEHPAGPVAVAQCKHLHTAVLQVLMVARPSLTGIPADDFLRDQVLPLLQSR